MSSQCHLSSAILRIGIVLLILGLSGCSNARQPESGTTTDPNTTDTGIATESAAFPLDVGTFTLDELFAAGGGGCGMTLWQHEANPHNDGFLFFHGLGDSLALMVFNDELTQLRRTVASGEEFYGQQTAQSFTTGNGAITVHVDITQGAAGEIESVGIPKATITIETQGQSADIAAVGDAGC